MPSMIITADWEHTETIVKGEQTEVVVPLPALKAVDPADDKIIAQILRELTPSADEDLPPGQDPPPWRRLRIISQMLSPKARACCLGANDTVWATHFLNRPSLRM